ncbi:hypothetical protein B0H16DRAFT_1437028 [Mycena metata]|uniref:SWIM-type domain-containing protein n=1 Tax=Mycena metata TaxID=1033252 RepID=A0AAD7MDQ1_9AGAR|nr:hypothetical protein B0H16DRAFT_1437028 [Mycena metata]
MPQGALDMVREHVEWLTPVAMVGKVQAEYPTVTAAQIHRAWMEMSEAFWRRDNLQLPSAAKLLDEHGDDVDVFTPTDVPEGVEMLCWGMKKIAGPLKGKIIEVGVDATYNTNSKHLELYSIMGEYDNAGFPVSYLLLSTASSIDQGKRRKALTAWAKCVRDTYGIHARFTHVDKDMAEIGMLKDVWNAKISLCWWHLRRAVRTRLATAKLATTPYDPGRANAEFSFIDVAFIPVAQADGGEYEGGIPDSVTPVVPALQQLRTMTLDNGLRITLPARDPLAATTNIAVPAVLHRREGGEGHPAPQKTGRTFCPARFREPIVDMMEKHYCAHPLLPGFAPPNPEGIKRWAVQQMYKFCVEHGLRAVWAYLWENWYRKSRWELWARSVHPEIPVLKTTMILESHWRRIKQDFLHHFHMPRCDLLVWILVTKLAPAYYRKLDRLLTDTGRYRELPSWRKDFKRAWREKEKAPITLPVNPAYKTDVKKWTCTCRSLAPSQFLLCKHLVQGVHPVPPQFFLEVKRQRTAPFWVHRTLRPLSDSADTANSEEDTPEMDVVPLARDTVVESDDDDDLVDTQIANAKQATFLEAMDENIDLIIEFARGLKHQKQFRDQRMLQALEREGASFLRLARACLGKEKRLRSLRGQAPSTWDPSTGSAMFYRARPARRDENT